MGTSSYIKQTKLEQARSQECDAAEACQRIRENWRLTLVEIKDNQKQTGWVLPEKKLMALS